MMNPNILNKNPLMFFDRAVNAQLLGKDLAVSACLVEHIHEVRVFKDVLHLTAGKQVFDILGDSCWDLFVIIRQFFICLSGDFSHFQRCVISHPA